MGKDFITIIEHSTTPIAKTWDGLTTAPISHPNTKYYTPKEVGLDSLRRLSEILTKLAKERQKCAVVRGKFKGFEHSKAVDPEFKPGVCRKIDENFDDLPHHWVMFDIDGFKPTSCDPLAHPLDAIDEYVTSRLPDVFQGASYHWHLSNSFGHPLTGSVLKAHIWFWLDTPYNSQQLKAWKENNGINVDASVFQVTQLHYTANPTMNNGIVDPIADRCGLHEGWLSESVDLKMDSKSEASVRVASGGKRTRLDELRTNDKVARRLEELGMVKSMNRDGGINIYCPLEEFHSTPSSDTTTVYYLPNTGGFAEARFHCKHDGCKNTPQHIFFKAIGIDPILDAFDTVPFEPSESLFQDTGKNAGGGGIGAGDDDSPCCTASQLAASAPPVHRGVPKAQHLVTDQANAERITRYFKGNIISAGDKWYSWNGRYWEQDDNAIYVRAMHLSKIIHQEADEWAAKPAASDEERKLNTAVAEALCNWAKKSEMRGTIDAALYLAKRALGMDVKHLDKNPWLLTCVNGTVDLRTGKIKPHDPNDYITKSSPNRYVEGAKAPLFDSILGRVTQEFSMTTRPLAGFLKRWFGYCATASVREQKFVVHYGGGRNGKSTILDTIGEVLGDYAGTAAPGLVAGGGNDRHPTEIADLLGKRMVTAHESGEGSKLHEDFVKQATGGDKLKGRYMRADFFEFTPTHKLQLLTNYKPEIRGQDEGIWRRVLLVPYMVRFGTQEEVNAGEAQYVKDLTIGEKIASEKDAVLTWLVEGAVEWYRDGLNPPDIVLAASKDYQSEQDRVRMFVNDCLEIGAGYESPTSSFQDVIYGPYRHWCQDNGFMALGRLKLIGEILRVCPTVKRREGKAVGENGRRKCIFLDGIRPRSDF